MVLVPPGNISIDFRDGIVLPIDKPLEWTSFDVVKKIRIQLEQLYGRKKIKVGHAGTLDPLATGLLVVCTGKATKQIESIQSQFKSYTGAFRLGATTPSYDLETSIDKNYPIEHIQEEMIYEVAKELTGEIEQIPPVYSAIKKDGKRAYKMARMGQEVTIPSRNVVIHRFSITSIQWPDISFSVDCSKGTYIRSLVYDFGKKLSSGAHLTSLRRTMIGDYRIEQSWTIDQFSDFVVDLKKSLNI